MKTYHIKFITKFTLVKWLNIILSIYLVALASMPCTDTDVNSAAYETIAHKSGHEGHSHEKDNDSCSPFCACNCCGVQILSYFPTISYDFPLISSVIKTKEPFYKPVLASDFCGSIWQPPQIV
jgi:hypothetical protein